MPLAEMFLLQQRHRSGAFTARATLSLLAYRWPGNVRELANAVLHGAVLSGDRDVDVEHLPREVLLPTPSSDPALQSLSEIENEHVLRVLEACGGRQADAARVLGIGRTTLWRKLGARGIQR